MPKKQFTSQELKEKLKTKKWIMAYNSLTAHYDENNQLVMLIENYGPKNGFFIEGWRSFHFPRTSSIVKRSHREGGNSIFIIKPGQAELSLTPAFAPIGIESCKVTKNEIKITYAGYGGGGVSAAYSRGIAKGVKSVKVISEGGGDKLGEGEITLPLKKLILVSVDDTDSEKEGATYSLVHNIAGDLDKKDGINYLIHGNIQLFPDNPNKTRNCMGTVVGFSILPEKEKTIIDYFQAQLKKHTFSDNSVMCVSDQIVHSKSLIDFANKARTEFIKNLDEVYQVCRKNNIRIFEITGKRGLIGAAAGIGLYDQPDLASQLPKEFR